MKKIITISAITISVLALSCFSTLRLQANQNQQPVEPNKVNLEAAEKPRPRLDSVKMTNFYLKTGEFVSGKLVSEDKNQVTIERLDQSTIIASTYGKKDIDIKTLRTSNILEYKYYVGLAEYFSAKTWDFKDDPDDFIQAIRCYEKAIQLLLQTGGQDNEKIDQITEKIKKLEIDREVWTKQLESRAKLNELELEAAFGTRLKEIEDKLDTGNQKINKSIELLDKLVADLEDNQKKLTENISSIDKNISKQLIIINNQIENHRRIINRMNYFWEYYPAERRE